MTKVTIKLRQRAHEKGLAVDGSREMLIASIIKSLNLNIHKVCQEDRRQWVEGNANCFYQKEPALDDLLVKRSSVVRIVVLLFS